MSPQSHGDFPGSTATACARLPPVFRATARRRRWSPRGPVSAFRGSSLPHRESSAAIEGEGGHRTLAAHDAREWAIVTALAERFGHASAERALSGPGIEAIRQVLALMAGAHPGADKTAKEIASDAFAGVDPIAEEAIATFTGFLGSVAGDLALTLGAHGGVYIAGGIVPGWGGRFDAHRFLERFRAKGRFRAYLESIPVHVVIHPCPGLVGVEHLLSLRRAGGS